LYEAHEAEEQADDGEGSAVEVRLDGPLEPVSLVNKLRELFEAMRSDVQRDNRHWRRRLKASDVLNPK
jgi:hypothetical protein